MAEQAIAAMQAEIERLRAEADQLRRRVAELEARQSLLEGFLEHTPAMMIAVDPGGTVLFSNTRGAAYSDVRPDEVIGVNMHDILPPALAASVRAAHDQVIATGQPSLTEQVVPRPGGARTVLSTKFPIHDAGGKICAVGTVSMDITRAKQAEAEREAMHEKLVRMQQATIHELITPLLPLARGVVAMPIVGTVDSARARQIVETLLEGVAARSAGIAILDITGVKLVDTQVARALVQAAQAARLLGAQVVLTGIKPQIAQTLVTLGADLSGVRTEATLESGIAYALSRSHPA